MLCIFPLIYKIRYKDITDILNFSNAEFKYKFKNTKNQNFELVLKIYERKKLKLFIDKMEEIGQNVLFNIVHCRGILSTTVGYCTRL
jgi:hypothetical protein